MILCNEKVFLKLQERFGKRVVGYSIGADISSTPVDELPIIPLNGLIVSQQMTKFKNGDIGKKKIGEKHAELLKKFKNKENFLITVTVLLNVMLSGKNKKPKLICLVNYYEGDEAKAAKTIIKETFSVFGIKVEDADSLKKIWKEKKKKRKEKLTQHILKSNKMSNKGMDLYNNLKVETIPEVLFNRLFLTPMDEDKLVKIFSKYARGKNVLSKELSTDVLKKHVLNKKNKKKIKKLLKKYKELFKVWNKCKFKIDYKKGKISYTANGLLLFLTLYTSERYGETPEQLEERFKTVLKPFDKVSGTKAWTSVVKPVLANMKKTDK